MKRLLIKSKDDEHSLANLMYSIDLINACVIDLAQYTSEADHISLSPDIEDNRHIHIFHDLCHWFHPLNDFKRMLRYYRSLSFNILFAGSKPSVTFYTNDLQDNAIIECLQWGGANKTYFEEIRTILCAPKDKCYQEGDDLLYYLFRLVVELSLA